MLKHLKTYIKRFMIIATVMVCTLPLSGCDGFEIPVGATNGIESALALRLTANTNIAIELYKSGLINETAYNALLDTINNKYNSIVKKLGEGSSSDEKEQALSLLAQGIVDWRLVKPLKDTDCTKGHTSANCCPAACRDNFIFNAFDGHLDILNKYALVDESDSTINPIELIDPATAETLQQTLNYPIYVLNPSEVTDLAQVNEFLNSPEHFNEDGTVTEAFLANADKFFVELEDPDGNTVTLLDPDDEDSQIISISSSPTITWVDDDSQLVTAGVKLEEKDSLQGGASTINEPGIDLVIYQRNTFPVMRVRFREFNQAAFENIRNQLGLGEQKYLVVTNEAGGRIYLLQYPVGYLNGFGLSEDGQKYEADIAKSNLEINLKTGKIYKVDISVNVDLTDSNAMIARETEVEATEPYISLNGGQLDTSSFVIYGETGVSDDPTDGAWNLKFGGKRVEASIPRIVLRDYLEISYSPGVVANETFVAYGRKVRILNFTGPLNQTVAKLCGTDGTVAENAMTFDINDFADYKALNGSGGANLPYVKYIPSSTTEGVSTEDEETAFCEELSTLSDYNVTKVETLRSIARDSIQCGMSFPGAIVAKTDYNLKDAKPLMYGLIISKNYSESGLINWVASESQTESTYWWNSWLKSNDFAYQIGNQNLLNYLKENYTYELGQAGYIMLDLDTLSKLQEELDAEAQAGQTHTLRTFFKVLGYVLVGYAFILMMCWVADTSVDLGLNLTQKVSFGRLVAVAGDEELKGSEENNHVSYVGFQSMLLSCFKIIVIGLLLILVDIVSIVSFLTQTLGRIAVSIGEMIGG